MCTAHWSQLWRISVAVQSINSFLQHMESWFFFRAVLPEICLNVSTLQALALEYLVALNPFLLILHSYFIIELYDRKSTCLVTAWRPLQKVQNVMGYSYICNNWFICYLLFPILCQNLECICWYFDSNSNLPNWLWQS